MIYDSILDTIGSHFRGSQQSFDAITKIQHCSLGIYGNNHTGYDAAFRLGRNKAGKRIFFDLLDTQRDTLTLGIDGENNGLDLFTLAEVTHCVFTRVLPGDI